jgi:recombination protein RecR
VRDDPIDRLIKLLARLPGIGEKSGTRLAYFIWRSQGRYAEELARAVREVKEKVKSCSVCGKPSTGDTCEICSDNDRDHGLIMVVEEPQDLDAIESAGVYRGLYHVLGGTLSPIAGTTPDNLNVDLLMSRIGKGGVREVILATNPSAEGDATAAFLEEALAGSVEGALVVNRLARGIPVGSRIRYLDPVSLEHAVKARRKKD